MHGIVKLIKVTPVLCSNSDTFDVVIELTGNPINNLF